MNKGRWIAAGCLLAIVLVFVLMETPDGEKPGAGAPDGVISPAAAGWQDRLSDSILNRDSELVPRKEPPVDLRSLGVDLSPFKRVSDDPAVVQVFATRRIPSVGTITTAPDNRVALELDKGRRFEATLIGEVRSQARDGTVAFDAITAPNGRPIKRIDADNRGVATTGDPSEVWVITGDGKSERVSPPSVHGKHPIISPDGRYVAFVAQYVIRGALHPKVLMIKDRIANQLSSYAERKYGDDYHIAPIDWVEEGKVLRVFEDYGETGGHMGLKQVRVK